MARPWEYAPWRRKVMQLTLAAVLGLSVLIAWLIVRQHRTALAIKQWHSVQIASSLLAQFPESWPTDREGQAYIATEPHKYLGVQRTIRVETRTQRGTGTLVDLARRQFDGRISSEETQPFEFLGSKGILVELPELRGINRDTGEEMDLPGKLYAITVLPTRTVVAVSLSGPRAFVPADWELLKKVATSLKPLTGVAQADAAEMAAD